LLNGEKPSANRKRPHTGPEEDYEQLPRKLFAGESNQNVKALLPIKTKKGIIPQMVVEEGIHIISFRYFIFRIVTVCYFRVYKVK
jgi:hypothetical protein